MQRKCLVFSTGNHSRKCSFEQECISKGNLWERVFGAMQASSGGHTGSVGDDFSPLLSFPSQALPSMTISTLTISEGKPVLPCQKWCFRAEAMSMNLHDWLFSRRSVSEHRGNPLTLSCMQSIPYRMLVIQWWGNLR